MEAAKPLCGFCPISKVSRYGPNEADTTISVASGCEFPICTDCLMDFHESLYNDWLAHQDNEKPAGLGVAVEDF